MQDRPPRIADSTRTERFWYIKDRFPCLSDCDLCGFCAAWHGKDALEAYAPYIEGTSEFSDIVPERTGGRG